MSSVMKAGIGFYKISIIIICEVHQDMTTCNNLLRLISETLVVWFVELA